MASKSSKEVIEFQREVILRKVSKTLDRRYKSGYREVVVLAESRAFLHPQEDGALLTQEHIHKGRKGDLRLTRAGGTVTFPISLWEQEL